VVDASENAPRERGSVVHGYLKTVGNEGVVKALEEAPAAYRDELLSIDVESLPHAHGDAWGYEVAYAYDPVTDTARELHRKGDRDYSDLRVGEIAGTLDLVAVDEETVYVPDVKTGWGELEDPFEALQILAGALAASRATGRTRARVGWLRLTDGLPRYRWATIEMLDLDTRVRGRVEAIVESVRAAERLPVEQLEPRIGGHCKRCPAFERCPAQSQLARVVTQTALAADHLPLEIAPTHRAEFVRWVDAIGVLHEKLANFLNETARREPIQLPDGKVYGPVTIEREYIDGLVAERVLTESYPALLGAVAHVHQVKVSKGSITDAVKEHRTPGRTQTSLVKEVLAAIRAQGGAYVQTHEEVKAHRPKPALEEPKTDTPTEAPQETAP
jgi:hypothetical protein